MLWRIGVKKGGAWREREGGVRWRKAEGAGWRLVFGKREGEGREARGVNVGNIKEKEGCGVEGRCDERGGGRKGSE